jgi:hypothetical protein
MFIFNYFQWLVFDRARDERVVFADLGRALKTSPLFVAESDG